MNLQIRAKTTFFVAIFVLRTKTTFLPRISKHVLDERIEGIFSVCRMPAYFCHPVAWCDKWNHLTINNIFWEVQQVSLHALTNQPTFANKASPLPWSCLSTLPFEAKSYKVASSCLSSPWSHRAHLIIIITTSDHHQTRSDHSHQTHLINQLWGKQHHTEHIWSSSSSPHLIIFITQTT